MRIARRTLLASLLTTGIALPRFPAQADAAPSFTFESVQAQAMALAKQPYRDTSPPLPDVLKRLDYAHFRMIKFRADQAFWRDGGFFQVRPIHRGFQYERRVSINLVENGVEREIAYDPAQFDFGGNNLGTTFDSSLGFAGLALAFPLDRPDEFEEFVIFLGASYFRMLGRGQAYGASARCLAIDTAGPEGEEVPALTAFWLERPAPDATSLTLYALLDSKSVVGAYKIVLSPGMMTLAQCEAALYPRLDIRKLGLAPINTMFLHGKPENRPFVDIRPEVHDSDTILMHRGNDEWVSRPLLNPQRLRVSDFFDEHPKGFGLVQRETDFRQYQDPVERFEARPSLWVEPEGDWGSGAVELIEIPSDAEINDNVIAYWVSQQPVKAGTALSFAYRLTARPGVPPLPPTGRCIGTRTGPLAPAEAGRPPADRRWQFWIDFAGRELAGLSERMPVEAVVTVSKGKATDVSCRKLETRAWRAAFTFTPEGREDVEMRAYLRLRKSALSETWTYRLSQT
ncbi:MAG TPA: glucan biosynthesis protein [Stellaceae bacterium]|nr:glucan biosynthesis protein [Stellaceae bacterium]